MLNGRKQNTAHSKQHALYGRKQFKRTVQSRAKYSEEEKKKDAACRRPPSCTQATGRYVSLLRPEVKSLGVETLASLTPRPMTQPTFLPESSRLSAARG